MPEKQLTPVRLIISFGQNESNVSVHSVSDFYNTLMQSTAYRSGACTVSVQAASPESEEAAKQCRDLLAFLQAYQTAKKRLSSKMEQFNRTLAGEAPEAPDAQRIMSEFVRMNQAGKYIRGALVNIGYSLFSDRSAEYSDDLALAFELFQTAVLIHDDIIDHARLRRGQITIHENYLVQWKKDGLAYDETCPDTAHSLAICAGDMGMYLANLRIAEAYADSPQLGRISSYFFRTALKTLYGEVIDVALPFYEMHRFRGEHDITADILNIYRLKTAWYTLIGPLCLGALLAGCSEAQMHQTEEFAEALGIAFQIKDDIIGIYGNTETGKDVGSDISEYKQTLLYAYTKTTGSHFDALMQYYGKKDLSETDLEAVRDIFRQSGALSYAEQTMNGYFDKARTLLLKLDFLSEEKKSELLGLVLFMKLRNK
ncbi:MAG: polyprenyl synthetase family protein [Oscillospiraceae bacterium]|nr:polyprenyl synthetase family protein [Oscillospiraceae bacterium]